MKILVVDDHPVMRAGIRACLQHFDSTIDVLETGDLPAAIQMAREESIDLVLLDLALPGIAGVDTLVSFKSAVEPCPAIVVFSGTDDSATVIAALNAGAMGYIPKTSSPAILQSAMNLVLANGIYVPPSVLGRDARSPENQVASVRPLRKLAELGLTPRQQQVCALMVKGKAVKQIARELGISPATAKAHLQPILRALHVVNRTEAIVALHRTGFSLETDSHPAA